MKISFFFLYSFSSAFSVNKKGSHEVCKKISKRNFYGKKTSQTNQFKKLSSLKIRLLILNINLQIKANKRNPTFQNLSLLHHPCFVVKLDIILSADFFRKVLFICIRACSNNSYPDKIVP